MNKASIQIKAEQAESAGGLAKQDRKQSGGG